MEIIITVVITFLFFSIILRWFFRLITNDVFFKFANERTKANQLELELIAERKRHDAVSILYLETAKRLNEVSANQDRLVVAYEQLKSAKIISSNKSGSSMSLQTWRRIVKLSHPDVHNGSKEAEEVMKILLEMKPK